MQAVLLCAGSKTQRRTGTVRSQSGWFPGRKGCPWGGDVALDLTLRKLRGRVSGELRQQLHGLGAVAAGQWMVLGEKQCREETGVGPERLSELRSEIGVKYM